MNYLLYRFIKTIFFIFFKVFNRLEVIGYENIPEKGGFIVAANHLSYLDPPIIGTALKRCPTYIAKEGLFRIPLLGKFIKLFSFSVNRDRVQPSTIKEAVSRLKEGEIVVVFPEGGRSVDGSLLDAKRGVGVIAAISRMPVVPTLIKGTEKALPVGAKFLRPAKITVIFGKPIEIDKDETDKQFQNRISNGVMEAIKNLKCKIKNYENNRS
ncbi:MAG: lysophospholipid acyltransferase family protein [Thermodesulfovibrionales bacterium]|nr:lysophospholipid acyltransferase family protein [Thermodesulfovibrionales bacterium]